MDPYETSATRYWGKADPAYPADPKWHPLVYHCLDVAAVGVEYLRRAPAQRRLFAITPRLLCLGEAGP